MPKGVFVTSTKTPFSWGTSGKAVQLAKDLIGGYLKISGQLVRLNSQSSMLFDDPSDMDEEINIDIEDEPEKRPAPRPIVPFFFPRANVVIKREISAVPRTFSIT